MMTKDNVLAAIRCENSEYLRDFLLLASIPDQSPSMRNADVGKLWNTVTNSCFNEMPAIGFLADLSATMSITTIGWYVPHLLSFLPPFCG